MVPLVRVTRWRQPIRIAIDTHIVDKIADTDGFLEAMKRAGEARRLVVVISHVIRDQLTAITRDTARRHLLLNTYDALPAESVSTHGFGLDVSRLDEARLGDDRESGASLSALKPSGRGGMQDALIAATASGEADILVSEDHDLCKKVKASSALCVVWSFADLVAFVNGERE